ncbi:hypothetical protein [Rhizobium sp. SYY.PMSO]|uniref:hypothetical protein n=1 Tax=Rhizobium sp. SYY.PMSO TaxID=3382192 RepID=UPI00399021DB
MTTTRFIDVKNDASGRSHLKAIEAVELVPGQDLEIWQSFSMPANVPFYPAAGATLFRYFVLPAPEDHLPPDVWTAIANRFFAQNKIEHCRIDSSRHPLMHATPSEDCVMLLSGRAQLILDDGPAIDLVPLDVIRQRQTNHSWVNLGPGPAVFISLMHGVDKR